MHLQLSNLAHLPELHRLGHTCASLDGELLFFWGGISDKSSARQPPSPPPSQPDRQLWIYDTLTGYWRQRLCQGDCPGYLSGATSVIIGRRLYLFGGHSARADQWLNSLHCLDLETFEWRKLGQGAHNEPAEPIRCDKQVGWAHAGSFYVFGGYGLAQAEHLLALCERQHALELAADERWPRFGWNNQLVGWDTRRHCWTWPAYSGRCPSARAAHSGALQGDRYFVFGGRDSSQRLNDLYALDLRTFHWSQLAVLLEPAHQLPLAPAARPPAVRLEALQAEQDDEEDEEELYLSPRAGGTAALGQPGNLEEEEEEELEDEEDDERKLAAWLNGPHLLDRRSLGSEPSQASGSSWEPELPGPPPEPPSELALPAGRSFASFTPIGPSHIYLFGGVDNQGAQLADSWLLDTERLCWRPLELGERRHPRLWHSGAQTRDHQVLIVGGSCSNQIDAFCTDVLSVSLGPSSLRKLALDAAALSVKLRSLHNHRLPSHLLKLIKLRKRAILLTQTGRRCANHQPVPDLTA